MIADDATQHARYHLTVAKVAGSNLVRCPEGHAWVIELWTGGKQDVVTVMTCYCGARFHFRGILIGALL